MFRFAVAIAFILTGTVAEAAGVGNIGNVFGALMGRSELGGASSIDEALARMTSRINEKTPMTVDKETRLDKVTAEPGARLIYHYTLVDISSNDISSTEFQNAIKPRLKSRLCASSEMQSFLKNGVRISYLYRGRDGAAMGGVEFIPSDCGYKT